VEETTVSIIGIVIASIIMFMAPLIIIADRSDDISQLVVQTATEDFVDDVIKTGKITQARYKEFLSALVSSGNTYEIDMEVKFLDENTARINPSIFDDSGVADDYEDNMTETNTYYSIFTSQIEDKIQVTPDNPNGKLLLKQGDEISVTVRNSSKTFSQAIKSFYYNPGGESIHIIVATGSGTVAINGSTTL